MIHVVRLPPTGHWDQTMIDQLLSGALWPHNLPITFCADWPEDVPGIILVIPGRFWTDEEPKLGDWRDVNAAIAKYDWVIAIRMGDEEDWFHPDRITHPRIKWWIQEPRTTVDYGTDRFLGVGFTPHFAELPPTAPGKYIDAFLAGQCTHPRRQECFDAMERITAPVVESRQSAGFTQGLSRDLYTRKMLRTKVVPCPSGPATPDTFRLYEALQAHCIPIADGNCPNYDATGYWGLLHPDAPFPVVSYWDSLPELTARLLVNWPANANRLAAWWMREKRRLAHRLVDDLLDFNAIGADDAAGCPITTVIPVSPIPSHPSIHILEQTVESVLQQLPETEIIITFDGVRAEQEHLRPAYEEAIRQTLWRADHVWKQVTPVIFDQHYHQVGMMRATLDHIDTPLLMYVEQDCPLVTDQLIDWDDITAFLTAGDADLIRLHHESQILDAHKHLTHGVVGDYTRTSQWSQRPHIATTAFYRRVLGEFTPYAMSFIEDKMASVLECANQEYGMLGWHQWRCWIYTPKTPSIQRSYTTDGRAGGPKFDDTQRF